MRCRSSTSAKFLPNWMPAKRSSVLKISVGLALKGASNRQHAIAMRDFLFRIAAVQRLHPEHGGRLVRHPANLPRPGLHASERNARRKRQAGDFVYQRAGRVPDFHFLGEFARRMQIGERPMHARDQDVLAVGRRR